jgi:hypothetical protein
MAVVAPPSLNSAALQQRHFARQVMFLCRRGLHTPSSAWTARHRSQLVGAECVYQHPQLSTAGMLLLSLQEPWQCPALLLMLGLIAHRTAWPMLAI